MSVVFEKLMAAEAEIERLRGVLKDFMRAKQLVAGDSWDGVYDNARDAFELADARAQVLLDYPDLSKASPIRDNEQEPK